MVTVLDGLGFEFEFGFGYWLLLLSLNCSTMVVGGAIWLFGVVMGGGRGWLRER